MQKKTDTLSDQSRPPVITILGHVDHGKTTLLDYIRKTHVQKEEAGGITQGITAYQIEHNGRKITFIDTPGHAAFSKMRKQGGAVSDISILVVAADDAVMPQTEESIKFLQNTKTPFMVAINKTDLPDSDSIKVKTQLGKAGVYVEGFGGSTPVVEISAKTGENIDSLLETILLMADMEELSDNSSDAPRAVVLEASLNSAQGPTTLVIVKAGTFSKYNSLFVGEKPIGKVRFMRNSSGDPIDHALPSTPVRIIGLSSLPETGDVITTKPKKQNSPKKIELAKHSEKTNTLLKIVLKADVLGSLEAIKLSLPPEVALLSSETGEIVEADVNTAQSRNGEIIGFNVKVPISIKKLSQIENIKITRFKIIYELLDYLQEIIDRKQEEIDKIPQETATLEVLKIFTPNHQKILGCLVVSGKLEKNNKVEDSTILSLKIGNKDVTTVKKDQQCGILLKPELDVKEHSILKSYN